MVVTVVDSGSLKTVPWPELQQKVETGDFVCSIEHIKHILNWEPKTDLATGLEKTAQAYRVLLAS